MASSQQKDTHTDFLLTQLDSFFAPTRVLAHLCLIQILMVDKDAAIGSRILTQIQPILCQGKLKDLRESTNPPSPVLLKSICDRPENPITFARLTTALVATLSKVIRPPNCSIYLSDDSSAAELPYRSFATSIYILVNSDILSPPLAQSLLQSLFVQLNNDTLLFLASIWTSGPRHIRVAALRHALAFVNAHSSSGPAVDFQLLVPALLILLQDEKKEARSAALAVLRAVAASGEKSGGEVYAIDTIYGANSGMFEPQSVLAIVLIAAPETARLLHHADLQSYLQSVLAISDELIVDPQRLTRYHTETLGAKHGASKKNTS